MSLLFNKNESPMLYDLRGHIHIANLGLHSRKGLEEKMLNIATIIISNIMYKEEPWMGAVAHITYHLAQDMVSQWQRRGSASSAREYEYASLLSGYTLKSLVPSDLPIARGNVDGNWAFYLEEGLTDSDFYTKVYYDLRYVFSTAVHEDRHIYEQHLYEGHDFYIGQKTKTSINSILTTAKNSLGFNTDDAWIVLNSEK
uniref:Uncharacterized protein n=1 Tax=Bracon brevicornis TaxID=1563983 RepID=A0A6V7JS76_9HYME